MTEQAIDITMPGGVSDAYLYSSGTPRPGVLCLPDIGGIRESNRALAQRIADAGYTVLLPNVFYRAGRTPLFSFPVKFGEERTMKRVGELAAPLTPEHVAQDAAAYVDFFGAHASVKAGKLGVVGYCFTGSYALRTAAARPEKVAAAASFHGGRLYTDAPTSPHVVLPNVKARLYFGHAENDGSMPADAIAKLDAALAKWGGRYESEVYTGAAHGWTHTDAPIYNQPQAERAFEKLTQLLSQELR